MANATPAPPKEPEITIQSAAPSAPALTEEQRKARLAELRKRLGRSRLEVRGLAGKHYFWAHRSDEVELDRLDIVGYSIVREPNAKEVLAGKAKPRVEAAGLREDGVYRLGDVILMECDQDVYEMLMLENDERSANRVKSAKDSFIHDAQKHGVPVFETDKSRR